MDQEPPTGKPSPSIGALLALLTDESRSTQKAAIKGLTDLGSAGARALEEASDGDDPKLRARARQALQSIVRTRGKGTLARLLKRPSGGHSAESGATLTEGLFAIDEILGFRELDGSDAEGCLAETQIDRWAVELSQAEAWQEGPTIAGAGALRRVLSDGAGLAGPERDFHNLQHVSLSRTIVTRVGLPLTLGAIYASVARANGMEAWLLPFPGQVLLGLGPPSDRLILDPFHGGALLSPANCRQRLQAMGAPSSDRWLHPASDRAMLERQTRNLSAAMIRHGREREARLFARLVGESSGNP
jgi:hypothetical protein